MRFREKFWNLGNDVQITRKPFEIEEFADCLRDEEGNVVDDQFVDISAGEHHFVALTGIQECQLVPLIIFIFTTLKLSAKII